MPTDQTQPTESLARPICGECDRPADWIRVTQFAGDHPFCDEHARQEINFGETCSYHFWEAVSGK